MIKSLTYKFSTTTYLNVFKGIVVLAMSWMIYDKLLANGRYDQIDIRLSVKNLPLILLCIGLSPINWLLESKKWQLLLSPIEKIGLVKTSISILSGITLGILTPGRIGEYGGRLMHVTSANRPQAAFAHFIGSLAQNLNIFILGGLCAFGYFTKVILINDFLSASILGFSGIMTIALGLLYYRNEWISKIIFTLPIIVKYFGEVRPMNYSKADLDRTLLLSFARHFIYMSQYVILLMLFDVRVELYQAYYAVGVIYLLQSSIALPPALGLIARSELAIIILKVFDDNYTKLLSVPLLLWTINLLIPALIGLIYIMMFKEDGKHE